MTTLIAIAPDIPVNAAVTSVAVILQLAALASVRLCNSIIVLYSRVVFGLNHSIYKRPVIFYPGKRDNVPS